MENFNEDYYRMDSDGADNHPLLAWGKTGMRPFIRVNEINFADLNLPLEIEFDTPYPKNPEMADFLDLGSTYVISEKIKSLFEKLEIPKAQFVPVTIITNKKEQIEKGFYIFHCWNGIAAIDKKKYVGNPVDAKGRITALEKFLLDNDALKDIDLKERLVFRLSETPSFIIIHKSIKEAIEKEHVTGFRFYQISKWSSSAIFEEE